MKVVIAIDSFKGSVTSMEAGEAVAGGIRRVDPLAQIRVCPLADGGEGTTEALVRGMGGRFRSVTVSDPLCRPVEATYGILESSATAIMEMSACAGLPLLHPEERDPLRTTTYGVGEMIRDAIAQGCRSFLIGIGGSATNDGGVGMLQALGFGFLNERGEPIAPGARGLAELASIELSGAMPELSSCRFHIACDVKNVLCGAQGCSAVYGPQKGATPDAIVRMDADLKRYAALTAERIGRDNAEVAGVGAAGGMGFAFLSYLNGELEPGVDLVIRETRLADAVANADVVVTGEGRLDEQTCMGKAPAGVAKLAKDRGLPVIAFSGCVADSARACNQHGIDAFFPILRRPCTLEEAMDGETARKNLADTAEQAFRLAAVFGLK